MAASGFPECVEAVPMRGLVGMTVIALSVAGALQAQEPGQRRAMSPPPPPAKSAQPRVGYAATAAQAPAASPCGQRVNAAQAERNATGKDALGRILPPPGIAAMQAATPGQIVVSGSARNAQPCYRSDGRGHTEAGKGGH